MMKEQEFIRRIEGMIPVLFRVCYVQLSQQADQEDAVQEALRRAWEKRHTLRNEQYMQTWMIRILINECHRIQRRSARVLPVAEVPIQPIQPEDDEVLLREALRTLDEKYAMPLLLHYIEGYSLQDVSSMLHLPQGTVKTRMRKGRMLLAQMIREEVFE